MMDRAVRARLSAAAYWTLPSLFCLFVYWYGLKAWFQQDDFAWLGLRLDVHSWKDLWTALFAPMAQGTIRPWSERGFFMAFSALFGVDPLPFRIWVFLTQFANLVLVSWIAARLTGSRVAGFLAPVVWIANAALAKPMAWTSAYNEILCAFFLLAALALLIRYTETENWRYWAAQWAVFLLGFGALELNVVYPALAAAYTLLCARKHFLKTLPLFGPSILFAWVHNRFAPPAAGGVYGVHYDASMLLTLKQYLLWALGPEMLAGLRPRLAPLATLLLAAVLAAFLGWKLWHRRWAALFPAAWFLIVIGPLLPLRDHVSEYYLTVPVIGLAMLGAWGIAEAWGSGRLGKAGGAVILCVYLGFSLPAARSVTRWHYDRSMGVRSLVLGVARAHELHPGKKILLAGVSSDLFWSGVYDQPFRLFGATDVSLTPGSEGGIERHPEYGEVTDFVSPSLSAIYALEKDAAVVYAAGGPRLRNVTALYRPAARSLWKPEEPWRVNVADPALAGQLGSTWYIMEGAHRWMPMRASVRLHGPQSPGQKLTISGYRVAAASAARPVMMRVGVDGRVFPAVSLSRGDAPFSLVFDLPSEAIGKPTVEVTVEVDRTLAIPGDGRELGAAFGIFEIR